MVLEHQLSACYAAGSLGGTLGRLNDSLRRLSRADSMESREKTGRADENRTIEPARLAHLDQNLRLMADAWRSRTVASQNMSHIDQLLVTLKENALGNLEGGRNRPAKHSQYRLLAQVLDRIKARHPWT